MECSLPSGVEQGMVGRQKFRYLFCTFVRQIPNVCVTGGGVNRQPHRGGRHIHVKALDATVLGGNLVFIDGYTYILSNFKLE